MGAGPGLDFFRAAPGLAGRRLVLCPQAASKGVCGGGSGPAGRDGGAMAARAGAPNRTPEGKKERVFFGAVLIPVSKLQLSRARRVVLRPFEATCTWSKV